MAENEISNYLYITRLTKKEIKNLESKLKKNNTKITSQNNNKVEDMLASLRMNATEFDTNVDIVFVIDATRSMQNTIDMVKASALSFQPALNVHLKKNKRIVKNVRIKVIWSEPCFRPP